ncbi:MAG: signal peptidase II [Chloroflexi bacterium]|nr:signal peptidase II [Chloroflexota bacterium]MCL5074410.1 signal peptidase II [Chloroflexota bacterium]
MPHLHLLRHYLPFFTVAFFVFALDQFSKMLIPYYIFSRTNRLALLGDWVRLDYVTNTGAAFGLLQGKTGLFATIALLVIPILILWQGYVAPGKLLPKVCLGLLLGGTLGNLLDRLRYGYVIDFIDIGIGNLRWPTFNLADSAFVIGSIILAWCLLTTPSKRDSRGHPA